MASLCTACSPRSSSPRADVSLEGPLHYASLLDVSRLIEAGELSPVELAETILARIELLDGSLHSYLTVLADSARSAARAAEQEIVAGNHRGPLHGVPIAVKDLCYTEGVPTTGGLAFMADFLPDYNATVVSRLADAGAVILGKLNLTEGAMAGYHPDFPIPVNPWDESLAVGGSSSGSGVATAAGLCYASLGTDTGGSIRFPSAANGIVGLKPTYGRVSRYGVIELAGSLDHVGPMTRYVSDAAAMFEVIAGSDPNDSTSLSDPVPGILQTLTGDIGGMRIGYDRAYATDDIDPGLVAALTSALAVIEGLGAEVVAMTLPEFTADHFDMWIALCSYEAVRAHSATFPIRAADYGAFMRGFLEVGSTVTDEAYAALSALRADFANRFREAVSSIDAVLCPAGHVPSPASEEVGYGGIEAIEAAAESPNLRFTFPADLAGTPTITLPCGANDSGAPYAMQLMGGRLTEPVLCRLAYAYEQATEWHSRHPAV